MPRNREIPISVIVPAYNAERTIVECLVSVAAQDHRPLELIVVDDGSTDATLSLAHDFTNNRADERDLTVRVLSQPNRGAPAARNLGMRESTGALIAFLDADDIFHREKLARQAAAMSAHPDWAFCYGPVAAMEQSETALYGARQVNWRQALIRQLAWPFFSTPGPVFRRAFILETGGWDETLESAQDWELHSRMMGARPAFGWTPDAWAYFRRAGDPDTRVSVRGFNRRRADGRALRARRAQLRSALAHAPQDLAKTSGFRRLAAWHLLRLARTEAASGFSDNARQTLGEARRWARGGLLSPLAGAAGALSNLASPRALIGLVETAEFVTYKGLALRDQLGLRTSRAR